MALPGFDTLATGLVVWGTLSAGGLFVLSRCPRRLELADPDLSVVFVIPALNEGRVIGATLRHLTAFDSAAIIVVDDGSVDDTADQVEAVDDPRIVLLRRELPDAQQGKGAALNHAYQWLRSSELGQRIDPARLVVGIVDADGRLEPDALREVSPCFVDPKVGAAQISVRIRNRHTNYWTNMQHFEFVAFTALYQRGRQRTGAVGLGGNGQFVRMEALASLGDEPWSDCLTEDMDVGIRLILAGWRTRYVPTTWVSQQAVPDLGRLIRQRTRWFQGTLQCLKHVPAILGGRMPLTTRMDLAGVLIAPLLLLVVSPSVIWGWGSFAWSVVQGPVSVENLGWRLLAIYVMCFVPAMLLAYAFWVDEPEVTFVEALVAGHMFVAYGYLWLVAGWKAVGRQLGGRSGWAKTARVQERPAPVGQACGVAA